jgi:peptidoglycan/xylan/chitin deacetylase (PgdA/CDA1 family)
MMAEPVLVTSWDDGHPADRRLAERLARHGIAATFFVPVHNCEGRPTMAAADWRALDAGGFEVAAHTVDHVRLPGLAPDEARRQLADGRRRLEDALGRVVAGFAYPGGRMGRHARRLAAEAGFTYARTTQMFCLDPGPDPLAMATTVQFHPHGAAPVLRNWLRHGGGLGRLRLVRHWLASDTLHGRIAAMVDAAMRNGGVLHLWGHGWEIEEQCSWPLLDEILSALAEGFPPDRRLTAGALAATQTGIGPSTRVDTAG